MQEVIKCQQCNTEIINNKSISCPVCGTIWYEAILDREIIDFMTTGTDPRLAPRSDSG